MAERLDIGVLQRLSELDGPSGFEGRVREYILEMARRATDQVVVDRLGSVIATKPGPPPRVLLIAHMDEIGLIVSDIDDEGFLFFTNLGGWDTRLLPGLEVRVLAPKRTLPGVIGQKPPHITSEEERKRVLDMSDLFVDTGLDRAALTRAGVRIGTPMVPATSFRRLSRRRVMGKAFDDRAGCYVLLRLLHGEDLPCETHFAWSVQEEVGTRGGGPVGTRVDPDYVIVVEGTIAADFPGVAKQKVISRLLGGPVVTVMDRGAISDPDLLEAAIEVARAKGIRYQLKKPAIGATDARPIHVRGVGYRTVAFATPTRYVHNPTGILDLRDLQAVEDIVRAVVDRLSEGGV